MAPARADCPRTASVRLIARSSTTRRRNTAAPVLSSTRSTRAKIASSGNSPVVAQAVSFSFSLLWQQATQTYSHFQSSPFTGYDKTGMATWPNGQLEVRRYGGPLHDQPSNLTAYNETVSIAWPVAVVRMGELSPGDNSGLGGETTAKLACIRADKASEGGMVPGKPSSTANGKVWW